ncbi:MAG: hypothetical protein ACI8TQ_000014 [Planctomycetota bacterium]|jgi:hypothetical protein
MSDPSKTSRAREVFGLEAAFCVHRRKIVARVREFTEFWSNALANKRLEARHSAQVV